jgi:PAS domain S-box-containing protein
VWPVEINTVYWPIDGGYFLVFIRDITGRRQAEQAVRNSEKLYRTLYNAISDAVVVHEVREDGPPGRFLEANSVACERLGYTRDELLQMSPVDIDAPDTGVDVKSIGLRVLAGESVIFEQVHLAKDGRRIPVEIRAQKFNLRGRANVLSLVRDITERKQAEKAVHESEEKLRVIFEGAVDGILVADAETRKFLIGNPAICRMLGYTPEEILRLGVPDIHPEQDLPHVMEQFERQLRGELPIGTDVPVKRKDGSVFYADIKTALVRFGGGDCLLGQFLDVTERKRAMEALRESEEQFRGLVEQSIAGIYIIQDGKFAYVNPRFAEIRGYRSAAELLGSDPLQLIAERDRGTVAEHNRRLLAGEVASIDYSFTALCKDGSSIEVGAHSAPANFHGRSAIIGLMQDISEKKRAEDEIKRYVAQLETAFMSTVEVATNLGEMRDPYTAGHQRRVAEIAVAIGAELGFDAHRQEGLRVVGYLHDIGKITIPSEILSKPGKLSAIEFQLIQGHAQAGYDVLKGVAFPWPVAQVALQHHERMDGSGYPQGLKGEAILLEARIMAVADVVEAMSSHRPYRPGLGIDKTLAEIERGRGTAYEPLVVDACLKLFREKGYTIPA